MVWCGQFQFHRVAVQSLLPRQVSIDVAWAPGGVDGRHYSYTSLARLVDLVFVMGYDEQSQMWEDGPCVARPNSPLRKTFHGVSDRACWVQGHLIPGRCGSTSGWVSYLARWCWGCPGMDTGMKQALQV